jgi:putative SOS response-associated peptidase YedK
LASLARGREPLRGTIYVVFGERGAAGWVAAANLVCLNESRPLGCLAGIWTSWTFVRKVKEGETTDDIFGFLTTEPSAFAGTFHPRAMPVILTTQAEIDIWMMAPALEALKLQRPLPDDALVIVGRGDKKDEGGVTL